MLWPESDDESARGALRRTLSVLRSALGGRWVVADRSGVALDGDEVHVDLSELEAAAASGDLAGLRQAASLARGPFLAGFSLRDSPDFDDWRATRAVAVERTVADVLERLASAAAASGDLAGAIAAASRRLDLDPLDEPARRQVMTLLARSGDRAGAIRQYRAGVAVLERELGVAPLAETTDLYEAIRDARLAAPVARRRSGRGPSGRRCRADARADPSAAAGRARSRAGRPGRGSRRGRLGRPARRGHRRGRDRQVAAGGVHRRDRGGVRGSRPCRASIPGRRDDRLRADRRAPPMRASRSRAPRPRWQASRRGPCGRSSGWSPCRSGSSTIGSPVQRAAWLEDQPAARARLLDAVATTLAALVAGPAPGLIVVEDLQWADDASREALLFLARRLLGRPLILLLTWRPEDLDDRGEAFAAAIERVPGTTAVDPGPPPAGRGRPPGRGGGARGDATVRGWRAVRRVRGPAAVRRRSARDRPGRRRGRPATRRPRAAPGAPGRRVGDRRPAAGCGGRDRALLRPRHGARGQRPLRGRDDHRPGGARAARSRPGGRRRRARHRVRLRARSPARRRLRGDEPRPAAPAPPPGGRGAARGARMAARTRAGSRRSRATSARRAATPRRPRPSARRAPGRGPSTRTARRSITSARRSPWGTRTWRASRR